MRRQLRMRFSPTDGAHTSGIIISSLVRQLQGAAHRLPGARCLRRRQRARPPQRRRRRPAAAPPLVLIHSGEVWKLTMAVSRSGSAPAHRAFELAP